MKSEVSFKLIPDGRLHNFPSIVANRLTILEISLKLKQNRFFGLPSKMANFGDKTSDFTDSLIQLHLIVANF